jgi:hypothetical protein
VAAKNEDFFASRLSISVFNASMYLKFDTVASSSCSGSGNPDSALSLSQKFADRPDNLPVKKRKTGFLDMSSISEDGRKERECIV